MLWVQGSQCSLLDELKGGHHAPHILIQHVTASLKQWFIKKQKKDTAVPLLQTKSLILLMAVFHWHKEPMGVFYDGNKLCC